MLQTREIHYLVNGNQYVSLEVALKASKGQVVKVLKHNKTNGINKHGNIEFTDTWIEYFHVS